MLYDSFIFFPVPGTGAVFLYLLKVEVELMKN